MHNANWLPGSVGDSGSGTNRSVAFKKELEMTERACFNYFGLSNFSGVSWIVFSGVRVVFKLFGLNL